MAHTNLRKSAFYFSKRLISELIRFLECILHQGDLRVRSFIQSQPAPNNPRRAKASIIRERERDVKGAEWLARIYCDLLWHTLAKRHYQMGSCVFSLRVNSIVLPWAPFLRDKYLESREAMWSYRQSLHLCECIFTMFKKIKMYQDMIKHAQAWLMHVNAFLNT